MGKNIVALFELGKLWTTPGALAAMKEAGQDPLELIRRHVTGDWSEMDAFTQAKNRRGVAQNQRIASHYLLSTGVKVWIVTEADRSETAILLSSEY